jgi:hypothetical protein
MADRRIGQERLGFAPSRERCSSLDELSGLIDWRPITILLKPIHASAKGEAAWPPLAMFKALLVSVWYDLSDVEAGRGAGRPRIVPNRSKNQLPRTGLITPRSTAD